MCEEAKFVSSLTAYTVATGHMKRRPWNIGIKGYKCVHKSIVNTDWELAFTLIKEGKTTHQISKILDLSKPTISKYIKLKNINTFNLLKENNKKAQIHLTKNGQAALYKKLRTQINKGMYVCEYCKSKNNLVIHHKEKLNYDKFWRNWNADNFVNTKDKVNILCSSCHQKLHYRKYNRKPNLHKCKKTGRYLKNE